MALNPLRIAVARGGFLAERDGPLPAPGQIVTLLGNPPKPGFDFITIEKDYLASQTK